MKLTSLLSQLHELETALQSFSLEELPISEASRLKSSFEEFKNRFEISFWGPHPDNQDGTYLETESESSRPVPTERHNLHAPLNAADSISKDVLIAGEPDLTEAVRGLKILVFEDDKFSQRLMEKLLTAWGCIHHITDNAIHGLIILRDQKIDLVLMDLHLPGTDGYEITDMIRQSPEKQVHNVPVIAISADVRIANSIHCQENSFEDFILKPYAPEELLMKMIRATKRHKDGAYTVPSVQNNTNPEPGNEVAIDLEPLLSDFLGQVDLVEEFAGLYKKNILEFIGQVEEGLQREDVKGIEFAAHTIKTGLHIIPAPGLLGIAETLHTMSRNAPDFETMRILHEAFIAHFPRVERELNAALEHLKKQSHEDQEKNTAGRRR